MVVGWDDEATRRAVRRYRWRAAGLLLLAVPLLAISVGTALGIQHRVDALRTKGVHVAGRVLAAHVENKYGGQIRVEFVAAGRTERRWVNVPAFHRYGVGDPVEVIYEAGRPSNLRTDRDPNTQQWAAVVLLSTALVGALALVAGLDMSARGRRWRRMLLRESWREASVRALRHVRGPYLVRVDDAERHWVGRCLASPQARRLLRSQPCSVVGDDRDVLLALDGMHLLEVRRSFRARRRTP